MVEALVIVDAPQVMHNLTIARVATYVVGSGQWVVHNTKKWCGYEIESDKWNSDDPNTAELANLIEDVHPHRIIGVGVPLRDVDGNVIPHPSDADEIIEMDILGDNFFIELKSSNGKGLTAQVKIRMDNDPIRRAAFGFAPKLGKHVRQGLEKLGAIGTNRKEIQKLLNLLRN